MTREEEKPDLGKRQHHTKGVTDKVQVRNLDGYVVDPIMGVRYSVAWYMDDGRLLSGWWSRADVEKYAAWSLLRFENHQVNFESQQFNA